MILRSGSSVIDSFFAGRTTFVNTLCGKKVLEGLDADDATNAHLEEGVRIKPVTVGAHPNLGYTWVSWG
jgi:septin family protein